jgi:predicted RNA polymerase sigma factor
MIEEAEQHLSAAARRKRLGCFQLEAAIQSAYAQRAHGWRDCMRLERPMLVAAHLEIREFLIGQPRVF